MPLFHWMTSLSSSLQAQIMFILLGNFIILDNVRAQHKYRQQCYFVFMTKPFHSKTARTTIGHRLSGFMTDDDLSCGVLGQICGHGGLSCTVGISGIQSGHRTWTRQLRPTTQK